MTKAESIREYGIKTHPFQESEKEGGRKEKRELSSRGVRERTQNN